MGQLEKPVFELPPNRLSSRELMVRTLLIAPFRMGKTNRTIQSLRNRFYQFHQASVRIPGCGLKLTVCSQ